MIDIYRSHGAQGVKNMINMDTIGPTIAKLAEIQLEFVYLGSKVTNGLSGRVVPKSPVIPVNCQ